MKALLREHFIREATHHIKKSKHHRAIAEHAGQFLEMHKAAAKSDMSDLDEILQGYIDSHAAIADEHADYAAHCTECAKVFSGSAKAAGMGGDDDLDALVPSSVSAVAPDAPMFRAVPRAGMRPLPAPDSAEFTFAKLFSTEE